MNVTAKFIGWVEYEPTHFHAEFQVFGDVFLPPGSQVNCDTLRALKIPIPLFPDLYAWRRARYQQTLRNRKFLDKITYGGFK